jgi:hypothetical protein
MEWTKRGLIYTPAVKPPLMISHACLPVPIHWGGDIYRVYFACRDDRNCAHIWWLDVRLGERVDVVRVAEAPALSPGPMGTHDEHGVYASSIIRHDGKFYLYTSCWNRGERPPLNYNSIGLAISNDGETFRRHSAAPILARTAYDPCFTAMPMVMNDGGRWRMWYSSGYKWTEEKGEVQSYYNIKYAESADGADWRPTGQIAIDHATPEEKNIARAWVVKDGKGYRAWYGFNRGPGYRLGYAASKNGLDWQRLDQHVGIQLSDSGWDSQMMEHPAVVKHAGRWFMFYNGNRFAKDGIGLAVADSLD